MESHKESYYTLMHEKYIETDLDNAEWVMIDYTNNSFDNVYLGKFNLTSNGYIDFILALKEIFSDDVISDISYSDFINQSKFLKSSLFLDCTYGITEYIEESKFHHLSDDILVAQNKLIESGCNNVRLKKYEFDMDSIGAIKFNVYVTKIF